MSHPISAFVARLQEAGQVTVTGCYTPVTLAQLAQSLSRLTFGGGGGSLLVADVDPQHTWAALAVRGIQPSVPLVALPPAPSGKPGFLLIGMGTSTGYALAGVPTEALGRDENVRLHDVVWSCDPAAVASLVSMIDRSIPAELRGRGAALSPPPALGLLRLSADLLDFAARQHSTLAVANRALSERLRNHEDQTRMIVHDMRAPLHTLLISIKALQRQRFDPDGQEELLTVARDSANYLLNLTETVLDSARLETSSWSLKRQPTRLSTLVQAVCEPLELAARPDQARLAHYVPEDLPVVWLDRGLMERVLTNLLTNAIKFTPPTGEIAVAARVTHDGHAIQLDVSDSGQGIPSEAQAQIFERFYQANEGDSRRGTGLGLYFCRLAVEAHGGSIGVQSVVGQGSTFSILLPLTGEGEESDNQR